MIKFVIIFSFSAFICLLFFLWGLRKDNKKRIKAESESRKQFEIDLKAFNATGLERKSVLDIKINEDIREKAEVLKKEAARSNDTQLYIIECINVDICPVCGEAVEEVSCPRKPGCRDILVKCTKCTWQLILADLSYD